MTSDSDDDGVEMKMLLPDLQEQPNQPKEITPISDQHHHLKSIASTITTRQLPSHGLSFQIWPAATTLVSLLDLNPTPLNLPTPPHPLRILELGAGTGLLGIAAAALLGAHVTLTDLPHVLPNLHFNALSNAPALAARGGTVEVQSLSWGDDPGPIGLIDVVMASDVVYYDHLFDPLIETLRVLVKGEVVFVMAHLRRWKRESFFFRKARKLFDFAVVHRDPPLPGSRTGVAVYRFTARGRT